MVEAIEPLGLSRMTLREKLKVVLNIRLGFIIPYASRWAEAMALLGLPTNLPTSLQKLAEMADEIWYQCGDTETSIKWYTKRALLTGVYVSTELFLITDTSKDFAQTWEFLDRRLDDFICASKVEHEAQQILYSTGNSISSFVSAIFAVQEEPLHSQGDKKNPEEPTTIFIEKTEQAQEKTIKE